MDVQKRNPVIFTDRLPARARIRPHLWELEYLAKRMRPDEVVQFVSITGADEYSDRVCALGMARASGPAIVVLQDDGMPACAGGYEPDPNMPGVWQSWMAGTPEGWEKHWREITRCTKWLMRELLEGGARRLETNALTSRTHAIEWYQRSLGLRFEGERRGYCMDGSSISMFSITQGDYNEMKEKRYGGW